jgi:hypothetical protein
MEFEVQELEEDDKVTVNVGRPPRALAAPNLNGETLPGFKLASESSSMKKQWYGQVHLVHRSYFVYMTNAVV